MNIRIRLRNSQRTMVEDFEEDELLVGRNSADLVGLAARVVANFKQGDENVPIDKVTATIKVDLT